MNDLHIIIFYKFWTIVSS